MRRNECLISLEETVSIHRGRRINSSISSYVLGVRSSSTVVWRKLPKLLVQVWRCKLIKIWQVIMREVLRRRRKLRMRRWHSVTIGVDLSRMLCWIMR